MSVKAVRDAVRSHFETQWALLHPSYQTTHPIVDGGQPRNEPGTSKPWIEFLIGPSNEHQRWMGAPRGFVQTGLFEFLVRVPRKPGFADGDLVELADEVASVFTGNMVSGIRFEPEGQRGVRRGNPFDDPDGPWRVCPVVVPYEVEFTKP